MVFAIVVVVVVVVLVVEAPNVVALLVVSLAPQASRTFAGQDLK